MGKSLIPTSILLSIFACLLLVRKLKIQNICPSSASAKSALLVHTCYTIFPRRLLHIFARQGFICLTDSGIANLVK